MAMLYVLNVLLNLEEPEEVCLPIREGHQGLMVSYAYIS